MRWAQSIGLGMILAVGFLSAPTGAYPPAVGILGNSPNCLACHVSNGPWSEDEFLIMDIRDKETKASLKQSDGSFKIEVARGEKRTLLTVIGRAAEDSIEAPYRNAWLYVDSKTIGAGTLSTFPAGWEVNLPMACRIVGDVVETHPGAKVTVLPMTIRATETAQNGILTLQAMLTKGEAVKGKAKEGMIGNYFERKVFLVIK